MDLLFTSNTTWLMLAWSKYLVLMCKEQNYCIGFSVKWVGRAKVINDSKHEWVCCIGVPYATHIWQVADASEQNGVFKVELTQTKREYLRHQTTVHFLSTDIVPLVKHAWQRSFGKEECVSKAIASRGWNPLNYC
jgi:hypothetical protein